MIAIYLAVVKAEATAEFADAYLAGDRGKLRALLRPHLNELFATGTTPVEFDLGELVSNELEPPVLRRPSGEPFHWDPGDKVPDPTAMLYVPIVMQPAGVLVNRDRLDQLVQRVQGAKAAGADLALRAAYLEAPQWSRRHGPGGGRSTRAEAITAIGGDALGSAGHDGAGVNVLIVDMGLDESRLPAGSFFGGWPVDGRVPGQLEHLRGVRANDHGMLIARNVLAVAPAARLYDCPLIPPRIDDMMTFLHHADAVLRWVRIWIWFQRFTGANLDPWVVVNAWAIFDRADEDPPGDYSENAAHFFNRQIRAFGLDEIDVVFAAGNCGGFGYDRRCGTYDVGPGRSIYGAHAHEGVLTVGSMRVDGLWAGSSSQGPGPESSTPQGKLVARKPDLCAPSHFSDPHDAHAFNGGTSTACALTAGAIAALRSDKGLGDPPSALMYESLRSSAVRAGAPHWEGRLGFGMLNAREAHQVLSVGAPHERPRPPFPTLE